jgi:hypothetical protein
LCASQKVQTLSLSHTNPTNIKQCQSFTTIFLFQLIQVLLQTPMIIDGLRRCSDLEENQTRKPGKPWITFLIIANLIMYLWETLEVKNPDVYKEQKQYYGYEFWIIISHVTLPLCIFYRFHSAAALADIWSLAYISGSH